MNMSMVEVSNSSAKSPAIAVSALENLAARFQPAGLFLMMLRPDGTVAFHDPQASSFFQRFVLPMLQYPDPAAADSAANTQLLNVNANVGVWNSMPGVALAAFPFVEKRQLLGVLVLAGKGANFKLSEDILRNCTRLGIDSSWLEQQANELPAYGEEAIQKQTRLLLSMVRDQMRVTSLESELETLSGQLANTYEELSLIYQVSSGMRINRRAQDFFKQACLDVLEVMEVLGVGVALSPSTELKLDPVIYGDIVLPPGTVPQLAEKLMVVLEQRKSLLMINDLSKNKDFSWLAEHGKQLLAVPLQRQDTVLGCLFALNKSEEDFDSVDSKLLTSIANESAIYLENAMLFDDVHGLMMGLLHSLTAAVDAKDAYTCGHSERVALFSRYIAQQLKLSDHDVERIYMAGLLHDVGKLGVPDNVLQKPGRLDATEFDQIKKHPDIGARILRDIKQIRDIIPGVLHHHERFDGRGYPANLAGEAIPLMGRIICLADCFDAMTTSRTYRKALPLEVAMTEIRRCAGTQFDPVLAEAFLAAGVEPLRELISTHQAQTQKLMDLQETLRAA
jgi:putative nucleotidyltransferase with HDIG domain